MQTRYFNAAWNDIKNSPGWFGKLVVLSLVGLIPVFGWIVVAGYLFGWARDIAWNVHAPLPAHVFGNEDGKLYSRGFFVMVIGFVCMLAPWVLELAWGIVTGTGTLWSDRGHGGIFFAVGLSSMALSLAVLAAGLFAMLFMWVGSMRMSVYGRLSAGFQFGKVWAMIRHDFGGLLRIFGMTLLLSVSIGAVVWLVTMLVALVGMLVGFSVGAPVVYTNDPMVLAAALPGLVVLFVVLAAVVSVLSMITSVFVWSMTVRALGYWTRQFDVPSWRGQDDPMPFQFAAGAARSATPPEGRPPVQG